MLAAVTHSRIDEVRRLAEAGVGLDERYSAGDTTPMIFAASSGQWEMTEILLDHGADIWSHDKFGVTAAQMTVGSRIIPGSPADQARRRVVAKMKARGYPFPAPDSDVVMRLEQQGKWPPAGAK